MFNWIKIQDNTNIVVKPKERLSWVKMVGFGTQHVVAMFGATFLVPLITGFSPSTTLFFSAISTALFLIITQNRVPSYLGSSFAFIAPISIAIGQDNGGEGFALFGVMSTGILLFLVGLLINKAGVKWIDIIMPPTVTGTIVAIIGFNLAPSAFDNFNKSPLTGLVTLASIVIIGQIKGIIGRLSILLGVFVGYLFAITQGEVDFSKIDSAAWFGLPEFITPQVNFGVLAMFIPVVLVLIAENIGHLKSVSAMTNENIDQYSGKALMADGLGTIFAGLGGGSGTTTYAENIGVMAATKIYSTLAYWIAAAFAMILSLCPKFGVLVSTVPSGVLGGAATLLYGMIGLLGVRILIENKVDFSKNKNLIPAAIAFIIGIANFSFNLGDITFNGIAIGSFTIIILYHIFNKLEQGDELDKADTQDKGETDE